MKIFFLSASLLFFSFFFQGCKKDDEKLTEFIYGNWVDKENISNTWLYYEYKCSFSRPNYCSFSYSDYSGTIYKYDSLTFTITDGNLNVYQKNGSKYSYSIEKLTGSSLHLKDAKGTIRKYKNG